MKSRCEWVSSDPLYITYHDQEWGQPIFDENKLFELLILESMQAGLTWITVLKKREHFRKAFDNFEASKIAHYDQNKVNSLMLDAGIIRNKLKIYAVINNANLFLEIKKNQGNFSDYIWSFVNHQPIQNHWIKQSDVPITTALSDHMSVTLKKRGFKFVGSTICYAFMQATGMVNDHIQSCFRAAKSI